MTLVVEAAAREILGRITYYEWIYDQVLSDPRVREVVLRHGFDAAHAALLERGANDERGPERTAKMPDHELWTAFVRDSDGNLVGLMEERR